MEAPSTSVVHNKRGNPSSAATVSEAREEKSNPSTPVSSTEAACGSSSSSQCGNHKLPPATTPKKSQGAAVETPETATKTEEAPAVQSEDNVSTHRDINPKPTTQPEKKLGQSQPEKAAVEAPVADSGVTSDSVQMDVSSHGGEDVPPTSPQEVIQESTTPRKEAPESKLPPSRSEQTESQAESVSMATPEASPQSGPGVSRKGSARIRSLQESLAGAPLGGGAPAKQGGSPGKLPAHLKGMAIPGMGMGGPPPSFRKKKPAQDDSTPMDVDAPADGSAPPEDKPVQASPGKLPAHLKNMPLPGFGPPPALRRQDESSARVDDAQAGSESGRSASVGKLPAGLMGMKIPMPGAGPPPGIGKRRAMTESEADFSKPASAPTQLEHPTSKRRRVAGALGRRPSTRRHRKDMVVLGEKSVDDILNAETLEDSEA